MCPVMSPGLHFFAASLMVALPTTALRSQKGYMTFMVAWHSPWWTFYLLDNNTLCILLRSQEKYKIKVESLRTSRLACEETGL